MLDILHRREHRLTELFLKMARFFLFATLVLVPLAYLPWTSQALEINKQLILVFGSIFAVLSWAAISIVKKTVEYKKTGINLALLCFLVVVAISSFLSLAHWTSIFGGVGQEYTSLLSFIAVAGLFFVTVNVLDGAKELYRFIDLLFITSFIVLFFGALSVFGITLFEENFIGAPNALGVFAVMAFSMSLGYGFLKQDLVGDERRLSLLGILSSKLIVPLAFIVLYALDYWVLWALLAIAILVIFGSLMIQNVKHITLAKILLPVLICVLSLLFMFVPTPGASVFPVEIAPNYTTSYQIAKDALTGTSWLVGSGPGTFELDYQLYKSDALNTTEFWNLSFNRSGSHVLTLLGTMGILGLILYLLFFLAVKMRVFAWLFAKKHEESWLPIFTLTLGWIVLGTSQFFYSMNTTSITLLFLLSAALLAGVLEKKRVLAYKKTPTSALFVSGAFVAVAILVVTTGFVTLSRYAADVAFAQALSHSDSGEETDVVIADMVRATKLNKWSDVYARNLSYALLVKTGDLLLDPDVNPESLQGYVANTVYYAQRAVELSPNAAANHSMLGDIYRELSLFVADASYFAISAYQNAIELAPTSPVFYVSLGRSYITQADAYSVVAASDDESVVEEALLLKEEALENAVTALTQSITLKFDYSVAQYYLALAYERQGNLTEAIASLEALQDVSPYDAGLAFQLGILYLEQGKVDEAQEQLEYVISLSPDYNNARWFLSSVYEQQGDLEGAIEQVELVAEENPDNELITQRLERLQGGLVTEEELEPLEEGVETIE